MHPAGANENKLRRAFLEESELLIEQLGERLLEIERDPTHVQSVSEIARLVHSLKAEAAVVGFSALREVADVLEDVFERVREGALVLERSGVDAVLAGTDLIYEMVESISRGGRPSDFQTGEVLSGIRTILGEQTGEQTVQSSQALQSTDQRFSDRDKAVLKEAQERGERFYRLTYNLESESPMKHARAFLVFSNIEKCANVIKTEPSLERGSDADDFTRVAIYVTTDGEEHAIHAAAEIDQVRDIELTALEYEGYLAERDEPSSEQPKSARRIDKGSIRVETRKLDDFWRSVGELILCKAHLGELFSRLARTESNQLCGQFEIVLDMLEKVAQELQQTMLTTRMAPIVVLFRRFPRLIRHLARMLGKIVEIRVEGEDTEIDRSLVTEISDLLTHIVRNSVNHGIEFPEERVRSGKPETGLITISARQTGGSLIIDVADDGKGVDVQKMRSKALGMGIIEDARVDDQTVIDCVFRPGFSSRESGVGLSAVATRIREALKGDIIAASEKGKGARFTIILPSTVNILKALIVRCSGFLYAIPVNGIQETVKLANSDLRYDDGVAFYSSKRIRVYALNELLGQNSGRQQECGVVIRHAQKSACLLVDEFVEEQEIVVRPIDDILNLRDLFSGVSVLGGGRIAYVIDARFVDSMQ